MRLGTRQGRTTRKPRKPCTKLDKDFYSKNTGFSFQFQRSPKMGFWVERERHVDVILPPPADSSALAVLSHYRGVRETSLKKESSNYFTAMRVVSTSHFFRTAFVGLRDRAFQKVLGVWIGAIVLSVIVTALWACGIIDGLDSSHTQTPATFAVNTTLSLMLVFRLSRAAVRWWDSRQFWGGIIANTRIIAGRLCVKPQSEGSLLTMKWLIVTAVATRCYLRRSKVKERDLIGVLDKVDIERLNTSSHMVITSVHMLRRGIASTDLGDHEREGIMKIIDNLVMLTGGLERIRNSPLPIVYTAHLRTFLLLYLLALPLFTVEVYGWFTPLAVALSGFVFLGGKCTIEMGFQEPNQSFFKHLQ